MARRFAALGRLAAPARPCVTEPTACAAVTSRRGRPNARSHAPGRPPPSPAPSRALPLLRSLDGRDGAVTALSFSPDGALLASGGWDENILLWSTGTERAARVLRRGLARGDGGAVSSIAFARSGATVAA